MRLLQSVLATFPQTKLPQRHFIAHLLGLLLMLPGHATFRHLSRYRFYHERTFGRWDDRPFAFISLNKALMTQVIPPEHQQALIIDTTFMAKTAPTPMALNGSGTAASGTVKKGWRVSATAWLDITDSGAYGLRVEQTPPSDKGAEPQATRIDAYLDQVRETTRSR